MSTLNLYTQLGDTPVRPDERFHLQWSTPEPTVHRFGFGRRTSWSPLIAADGQPGRFISWAIGWGKKRLQIYHGTAKCDGSRTHALRTGQLGGELYERTAYVMTTTPKELQAFRIHSLSEEPSWDDMGGF